MVIKKVKGGFVVVHHHAGVNFGKRINATKKPVSHKKALAIHSAIFLKQKSRSKSK